MATVRTFYWDPVDPGRRPRWGRRHARTWRVGNAGDLLNDRLIEANYGVAASNVTDGSGRRLLLIGSVAHRVEGGDLVCGVGTKGLPVPTPAAAPCRVVATRGPITTQAFADAGHDVDNLAFEFDPGLLVGSLLTDRPRAEANRVIFIPHYRDQVGRPRRGDPHVVDIDAEPMDIALEILRAELVYTSSLHGLIFAHALGRPVVLVRPTTEEPIIKYQDYLASIGQPWRSPPGYHDALRAPSPDSPVTLPASIERLRLPALVDLEEIGIAT